MCAAAVVRVKFEKTGLARYISHLDLARLFARSLIRAGVEIAHSEGFNPRPKIAFASAIPLGIESLCEFADIKTPGTPKPEDIGKFFPQGINIAEIYEPETGLGDIDRTRYEISIKFIKSGNCSGLGALFKGDVFAEKKPGVTVNLKDYICDLAVCDDTVDVVLKSNRDMYLNPENIVKAVSAKYPVDDYSIKKTEVYDKNNVIFK